MIQLVRPKLGTYIVGLSILAVVALGTVIALPKMLAPSNSEAAALLKFKNPFGGRVSKPDVAGDWMTWIDYRDNGTPHIYTYNFSTNEEKMLSWGQPTINAFVSVPKIYEGFVAYNNRLSGGSYVMNYMNPFMYTTKQVAVSKQPMSAPSFDEQNIVWTQGDDTLTNADQVYWYDADRGVVTQLTISDRLKKSAFVDGTIAYWMESADGGSHWDIVQYNLDYASSKTILTNRLLTGSLSASGNRVAFAEKVNGIADIFTVNLVTSEIRQITKTGSQELNPLIFADTIAFDQYVGGKDPEIVLFDIEKGSSTPITNDTVFNSRPSLTQKRMAWSDASSGVEQIYFYDFRSTDDNIHFDLNRDLVMRVPKDGSGVISVPQPENDWTDTDGDGITDNKELNHFKTSPTRMDTDGDGLNDKEELDTYKTDPRKFDSDEDGYGDGTEVKTGHNPLSHRTKQARYGMSRDLGYEQVKARELKVKLEMRLGKRKIGIAAKNWPFYVNAYAYGGYSVDEIVRSSRGTYGVISTDIAAAEWRTREQYKKAVHISKVK